MPMALSDKTAFFGIKCQIRYFLGTLSFKSNSAYGIKFSITNQTLLMTSKKVHIILEIIIIDWHGHKESSGNLS